MFREARSGDFEDVVRLYRQLQPEDPVLEDGSDALAFEQILGSPGLHLSVLELDGIVVATTYLNVIPNDTRSASPYAVIENVVVEKSLRGVGLGKEIVDRTLRAAWEAGCYKAMLMTGSNNPATHAFYRACGFLSDAKQRTWHGHRDGRASNSETARAEGGIRGLSGSCRRTRVQH
jgi:GNAT superfamily N-acetyltransferase